jgi:hypothetical protein
VLWRLAGKSEKAVRQLYLTFGRGKTHSLVTLVHLVQDPEALPDLPAVQQFRGHCALDEWFARTMADLDPAWPGRLKHFLRSLTQAVTKVPRCCLVVSLLASDTNKMAGRLRR